MIKRTRLIITVLTTGMVILTGCLSDLKAADSVPGQTGGANTTAAASGGPAVATMPGGITNASGGTASNLALEAYRKAINNRTSDKYTFNWIIESDKPAKSGSVISENIYDAMGNITESKGEATETYGGETKKTLWYRTKDHYATDASGQFILYEIRNLKEETRYDFPALMEKLLKAHSAINEAATWYLRVNSNEEAFNKEVMKYLGYDRNEMDVWQGTLYLEARIEKSTGLITNIVYSFNNPLTGVTDTGEIKFSGYNSISPVEIPSEIMQQGAAATVPSPAETIPVIETPSDTTADTTGDTTAEPEADTTTEPEADTVTEPEADTAAN